MSDYDIALEVITGKWGNGDERCKLLRQQGYDPVVIQKIVNDILSGKIVAPTPSEPVEKIKEVEIDARGYTGLKIALVVD